MSSSSISRELGKVALALASFLLAGIGAEAQTPPRAAKPALPKSAAAKPVEPVAVGTEAVVETDAGAFTIRLLPDLAPRHARFFVKTALAGGFDGTTFHRIIAGGIIQGGDPLSKNPAQKALYGTGGLSRQPPWKLPAEFSDRPMTRASVAAVLLPGKPDSAGTQFFICLGDQPSLTGKYTIFGEVVQGMEVVDKIGQTPVEGDIAATRVVMNKVTVRTPTP
ncbi:MAG TPA: peptidylprolyl isomerase [Vicinamibacteria bacterium]